MQVETSLVGFSFLPSTSDSTSIEPTADSSSSLGSHPMITRAKAGIFKTCHPTNFAIWGSFGLLSTLLAST